MVHLSSPVPSLPSWQGHHGHDRHHCHHLYHSYYEPMILVLTTIFQQSTLAQRGRLPILENKRTREQRQSPNNKAITPANTRKPEVFVTLTFGVTRKRQYCPSLQCLLLFFLLFLLLLFLPLLPSLPSLLLSQFHLPCPPKHP